MRQEINLLPRKKAKPQEIFSFKQIVKVLGAVLLILIFLTLYQGYSGFTKRTTLSKLEKEREIVQKKLEAATKAVPSPLVREELIKEIKEQEEAKIYREEILTTLMNMKKNRSLGFSRYFKALAKQTVDGLWLTKFSFGGDADYLLLEGNSLKPEMVPRFMEGIGREPVFSGRTFQIFKIVADKKIEMVHFTLESAFLKEKI